MQSAPSTFSAGTPLEVQLAEIINSPSNPRKKKGLDIASLNELAASIRVSGVMQPIIIRSLPVGRLLDTADMSPRPGYEIIAGERRWRAAGMADLHSMPALLRDDLTDDQVAEMQLVENIQRQDLDALEEADGFELLRTKHGYDVAQITAKIAKGKGESFVRKRLTLAKLGAEGREAMYEEPPLDASIGLLIARYEPEQQADVLAYVRGMKEKGEWPSFRAVRPALDKAFNLVLEQAPFDVNDADLLPAAGSCSACPKRSGNQGDIFGDIEQADSCTDTGCFQSKREAHVVQLRQSFVKQGFKVIAGSEALAAKSGAKGIILGHQRLDALAYTETGNDGEEREVTFGDALRSMGKKAPKPRIFIDPHSLEAVKVITTELAEKLVPEEKTEEVVNPTAKKASKKAATPFDNPPPDRRSPEELALSNPQVQTAVLLRVFEAIRHGQRTTEELRLAVKALILGQEGVDASVEYMGFDAGAYSGADYDREQEAWIDALPAEQLGQLLAMASIEIGFGGFVGSSLTNEKRIETITSYGIDILAVRDKVSEDLAAADGEQQDDEGDDE